MVVPVFNSAPTLPLLLSRLESTLSRRGLAYELIFVDDGSRDASWQALRRLRRGREGRLKVVQLVRNFGQHNALLCGFSHCRGRAVVTLDDDLQHPPEQVPLLLEELRRGHDLVYGVPRKAVHHWPRSLGSRLSRYLFRTALPQLHPDFGPFRAMTLRAAKDVERLNTPFTFVDGSLSWSVGRVGTTAVDMEPRAQGASGYSLARLLAYTLNILTTFSDLPLRLSIFTGMAVAVAGALYGILLIVLRFLYDDISPGYTSVMAAILFLGGLILLAQGINGEYIRRINYKTSGRPKYLERVAELEDVSRRRRVRRR